MVGLLPVDFALPDFDGADDDGSLADEEAGFDSFEPDFSDDFPDDFSADFSVDFSDGAPEESAAFFPLSDSGFARESLR